MAFIFLTRRTVQSASQPRWLQSEGCKARRFFATLSVPIRFTPIRRTARRVPIKWSPKNRHLCPTIWCLRESGRLPIAVSSDMRNFERKKISGELLNATRIQMRTYRDRIHVKITINNVRSLLDNRSGKCADRNKFFIKRFYKIPTFASSLHVARLTATLQRRRCFFLFFFNDWQNRAGQSGPPNPPSAAAVPRARVL